MNTFQTHDWERADGAHYLPPSTRFTLATSIASGLLSTLGKVSPAVAARVLNRFVWCRPAKCKPRAQEEALLAASSRFPLIVNGRELPAFSWGDGPPVLLVHGWGGAACQMTTLASALADAGFRAIAFDAPAHGSAGGEHTDFPEFAESVEAALAAAGGACAIVAHSAGCVPSLDAIRRGRRVDKLVLISPFARLAVPLGGMAQTLRLSGDVVRSHLNLLKDIYGPEVCREYSPEWLLRGLHIPGLIVHDRNDKEVGWGNAQRLAEIWRHGTVLFTEGLGHHRILHDHDVVLTVTDYLRG